MIRSQYIPFPCNEGSVRETGARLPHDGAAEALIPLGAFVQLIEVRPRLAGAGRAAEDDLRAGIGLDGCGIASEFNRVDVLIPEPRRFLYRLVRVLRRHGLQD